MVSPGGSPRGRPRWLPWRTPRRIPQRIPLRAARIPSEDPPQKNPKLIACNSICLLLMQPWNHARSIRLKKYKIFIWVRISSKMVGRKLGYDHFLAGLCRAQWNSTKSCKRRNVETTKKRLHDNASEGYATYALHSCWHRYAYGSACGLLFPHGNAVTRDFMTAFWGLGRPYWMLFSVH